eukprot:TRINITY_DN4204_c0_g1_i1.p1 TRINITY_DN4204_c0_g1~~TRINITY_DN4204_c0_g1_i1.p1  ORF type:complete len:382 (+),score=95.60 TRINITY_DN4204_c0_g1_i1:54-1199(+)
MADEASGEGYDRSRIDSGVDALFSSRHTGQHGESTDDLGPLDAQSLARTEPAGGVVPFDTGAPGLGSTRDSLPARTPTGSMADAEKASLPPSRHGSMSRHSSNAGLARRGSSQLLRSGSDVRQRMGSRRQSELVPAAQDAAPVPSGSLRDHVHGSGSSLLLPRPAEETPVPPTPRSEDAPEAGAEPDKASERGLQPEETAAGRPEGGGRPDERLGEEQPQQLMQEPPEPPEPQASFARRSTRSLRSVRSAPRSAAEMVEAEEMTAGEAAELQQQRELDEVEELSGVDWRLTAGVLLRRESRQTCSDAGAGRRSAPRARGRRGCCARGCAASVGGTAAGGGGRAGFGRSACGQHRVVGDTVQRRVGPRPPGAGSGAAALPRG